MTLERESAKNEVAMDSRAQGPGERERIRAHWYSVAAAGKLLGVSETAVRKRIADGALTATRGGRGWRVLLPGDPPETNVSTSGAKGDESASRAGRTEPDHLTRTTESLVALVRDLQRQNLALAGHIGYLQSQIAGMNQQLEATDPARTATDLSDTETVTHEEHDAALREVEDLRRSVQQYREELAARPAKKRRWWNRG